MILWHYDMEMQQLKALKAEPELSEYKKYVLVWSKTILSDNRAYSYVTIFGQSLEHMWSHTNVCFYQTYKRGSVICSHIHRHMHSLTLLILGQRKWNYNKVTSYSMSAWGSLWIFSSWLRVTIFCFISKLCVLFSLFSN